MAAGTTPMATPSIPSRASAAAEGALGLGLVEGAEGGDQAGQQPPRVVVLDLRGRPEQGGGLRHRHALDPAPVKEADQGHVMVGVEPLAGGGPERPGPAVAPLPGPQRARRDAGHPLDGGDPVPGHLVVGLRRRRLALNRHGFLPPTRAGRHRGCRSRWRSPSEGGTSGRARQAGVPRRRSRPRGPWPSPAAPPARPRSSTASLSAAAAISDASTVARWMRRGS